MRRSRRAPRRPVIVVALAAVLTAATTVLGAVAAPSANANDGFPVNQTAPGGALFGTVTDPTAQIPYPYTDHFVRGPDGRLWFTNGDSTIYSVAADGSVIAHPLPAGVDGPSTTVQALLISADGDLWYTYGDAVIRVGADALPRVVATVPGGIDAWTLTDDSRVVVESTSRAAWTVSWVSFDGGVTSYTHSDTAPWTYELVPGPSGSAWGVHVSDGVRILLRPDGTIVPITSPTGSWTDSVLYDEGRALVEYGSQYGPSLGRLELDGTITPLVATPRFLYVGNQDVIYSTTPAGQAIQLRRMSDPAWSATIPLAYSRPYGSCLQSSTGILWYSAYDPSAGKGALLAVGPDGSVTTRLLSYGPYSLGYCAESPDGTLWSSAGANIAFSAYLRVSPDGSNVSYNSFGPNTSGPLVVTDDDAAWMPSANTVDQNSNSALLGHLTYADTSRTSGSDRFASAAAVANAAFPAGAPVVYLASGLGFADALAAGPAAAAAGGPLLLSGPDQLGSATSAALTSLHPSRIVLVGGTTVLSAAVQQQVARLLPAATIVRESGSDRYATTAAVVHSGFSTADTVYVATGTAFPDALSASAAAGSGGDPVLLVDGRQNAVDPGGRRLLEQLHPSKIVVVGGPVAVSDAMLADLGTIAPTTRIGGADRFAVSAAVAQSVFPGAKEAFLADGLTFPDALAGSVWAAREHAPLLTVGQNCIPASTAATLMNAGTTTVHLLGGDAALDPAVESLTRC